MSRSHRKVPIIGITAAASDKRYKKTEHSRERAAVKIALACGEDPPPARLFGDPCLSEKDGKQYLPDQPRFLRK